MEDLDPAALSAALSEIPLFKEVQRVLLAGTGPVNWVIASQIAHAVSKAGPHQPSSSDEEKDAFAEDCRIAELHVVQGSGLEPSASMKGVEVVGRERWADLNIDSMKGLLERLASRLQGQLVPPGIQGPTEGLVGTIGPFFIGVQIGFLVGYLSRKVLGHYDVFLPRGDKGMLYFVYPNISEVETELGVDPRQFRLWVSLHEVIHHLQFASIVWTRGHLLNLVTNYIEAAEIDPSELMNRVQGFSDPEEINKMLEKPEDLIPTLLTESQKPMVESIQAFMAVLEGHAEWIMDNVGRQLLPEFEKIREGINRRRAERSSGEKLLERLIGLDLKFEQYRLGTRFITAIAGADKLDLLWTGPDALPDIQELANPSRWLTRVAFN